MLAPGPGHGRRQSHRHAWMRVVVAALVLTTGCALTGPQKGAVSQFSQSAATLGQVTSSELIRMRETTVKMNTARLALGGPSRDPNLADPLSLDRGFDLKRVATISGATQALAGYGQTLVALVDDTQSATLKAASEDFISGLRRVPSAMSHISDAQLDQVGSALQNVAGFWLEWKRREAVRTVVKHARAAVDHLCDLLARDFDPTSGWVALQLQVVEAPLLGEAKNAFESGKTYAERAAALDGFQLAQTNRLRRTEVLGGIQAAAVAMKAANAQLVSALEDDKLSIAAIREFAGKASALQGVVKLISR